MALDLAEFFRNYVAEGVGFNAEPATEAALVGDLIPGGTSVLDLGGGAASFTETLTARGCSIEHVALAGLEQGSLESIAAASAYDVILLSDVLGFVREPEKLLQDCRSLLAPDGFIVASVANFGYGAVRLAMLAGSFEKLAYEQERNPRMHFFSAEVLNDVFKRAGYRSDELLRLSAPWDDAVADPRHAHVDESVIRQLKRDPENTTLMFVLKASPALRVMPQPVQAPPTVEGLQRELAAAGAELESALNLVEQLREAGRALQQQNAALRRTRPVPDTQEAESLRTELAAARHLQAELTQRIQRLSGELTDMRRIAEERSRESEHLQDALEDALLNLAGVTASRDEFAARLHALDSEMAELKKRFSELQQGYVVQLKRLEDADGRNADLVKQIELARAQNAATLERAEKAEGRLLTQTNGLLESTALEIQKLSDLVNVVQTSRFWKLKSLAAKFLGR